MSVDPLKFVFDIQQASGWVLQFTAGKTLADYDGDMLLRSAVERQLEIVGEAMSQLRKIDLVLAERIRDFKQIVAFRNHLAHGYSFINSATVWGIMRKAFANVETGHRTDSEFVECSDGDSGIGASINQGDVSAKD